MRTVSDIHENELRALLSNMRLHRRSDVGTGIAAIPGRLRPSLPGRRAEVPRVGEGGGMQGQPGFHAAVVRGELRDLPTPSGGGRGRGRGRGGGVR
jgi:hypothetical protein